MKFKLTKSYVIHKRITLLVMKSFIFLFCTVVFSFNSNDGFSQNAKIKIDKDKVLSVKEIFILIQKQTDYKFIYRKEHILNNPKISLKKNEIKTSELLEKTLSAISCQYEFIDNTLIVKKKIIDSIGEYQRQVSGTVLDQFGNPIPEVSIMLKGTKLGTQTDFNGNFKINVSEPENILVFSYLGYVTLEVVVGDKTKINVTLKEEATKLEEIIITGYQKLSVNKSTGSTSSVQSKSIERKGNSNLLQSLEGQVAGLGYFSDPSQEGAKKFNIRGVTSINGDSRPLIIVDGFPLEADISTINPYEVESVTFLKDAAATSIYGARAANGVVVVVTKKGKSGTLNISYRSFLTGSSSPDLSYRLNRVSSTDLVDIQKKSSGTNPHTYEWHVNNSSNPGNFATASTVVYEIMAQLNEGTITQEEADIKLADLRTKDNTSQFKKYFLQPNLEQQHNISISGGGDRNTFRSSLNYTKNQSNWEGSESDKVIFDILNNIKINDKVGLNLIGNVVINNSSSTPVPKSLIFGGVNSYEEIIDENGNYLPVRLTGINSGSANNGGLSGGKDPFEIKRLLEAGLQDETYYPLKELGAYTEADNSMSVRLQAMLNAQLARGLTGYFAFQYESGSSKTKNLSSKESFEMASLVNNTTPLSYTGDINELNIPQGDRLIETRSNRESYTLRGQLDFSKSFGNHDVSTILGSEIRSVFNTQTVNDKFGYDDGTLLFRYIDKKSLDRTINDVYHPMGYVGGGLSFYDDFNESTNRYFSMYGNFTYSFNNKYIVSGSARIDQSNLFGTDPEFRYKPFWSVGGKWRVSQEDFFNFPLINKLDFRVSYGINGNISNNYGPFNIATALISSRSGSVQSLAISSPAIVDLRWERTGTTNFGMDFKVLNNRIGLGLDYYIKNTSDLLANGKSNPTLGFSNLMKNDANIKNKGVEITLNTENIQNENFTWSTFITMRHNKNRVTKVYSDETYGYYASGLRNYEGAPTNTFWFFNWNGLNEKGEGTIKRADGNILVLDNSISPLNDLSLEDIVNAGTTDPIYSGAITNTFTYKNLGFSFMFIGNGGHVLLKDSYNGESIGRTPTNINKDAANSWKVPGDEVFTDVPSIDSRSTYGPSIARRSTKNIIKGDYLKLREVILTYFLSDDVLKLKSLNNIQLNLKATNLFYIAKNKQNIDPEAHGYGTRFFPNTPSYTLGVTVNF